VLKDDVAPDGLFFETAWPRLLEGGTELLDEWLGEHPGCRLVVIDVFAKVRGLVSDGNVSRYDADYAAMASLKAIADRHGVAVLVVHHTRKASADDYIDSVSGTHGLAGAADAVLVLKRSRGSADAKLQITGRDVEEAEYAMEFLPAAGTWRLLEGPAEEYELSATRRSILVYLREHGPATPKTIAEALGIEHDTARQTCLRMAKDEQAGTDGSGTYHALSHLSLPSLGPARSDRSDKSDTFLGEGNVTTNEGPEEERPLPPGLGDEMYPVLLADAARDGHITTNEFEERYALHKLVLGERTAA
jgi:hypothetical protein